MSEQDSTKRMDTRWRSWVLLVVDDEGAILRTLRALLARAFPTATILTAESAADGLRALREHRVHLVVTDHRMPGIDGLSFLERARAESPGTLRVLLTGHAEPSLLAAYLNSGRIRAAFTKPLDATAFVSKLAQLLEARQADVDREQAFARALRARAAQADSVASPEEMGPG